MIEEMSAPLIPSCCLINFAVFLSALVLRIQWMNCSNISFSPMYGWKRKKERELVQLGLSSQPSISFSPDYPEVTLRAEVFLP